MAIEIKRESYKPSELQTDQVQSATTNVSEEKSSSAQETPVNTSGNEKHSKGARELANSKKADAQLQAMSVKLQLAASEPTLSTAPKPANNVQQLGQSANDQGPVVSKQYAQQKDSDSQTEKQNTSGSLSKDSAGARGVSDNTTANETRANAPKQGQELSAESLKHNQEIVNDAVTFGRTIEKNLGGDREMKKIQEFIPGPRPENLGDMEVYYRDGLEMTVDGERIKIMNYFEPHKLSPMGVVESVIKNGKETITKITEYVKGSMSGLKEGDTRDVPPDVSTLAGKKPSSFNPQPDGRYGLAGEPNSQPKNTNNNNGDSNKGTQSSSEKGQGVGRSLDGSAGPMFIGKSMDGGGGGAAPSSGKVFFNSTDNGKTWENGRSQWTENPPTQVDVEQSHESRHQQQTEQKKDQKEKRDAGEKPQFERPQHEATHETNEKDHGSQAAYGDYADAGVTAPAQHSASGEDRTVKAGGNSRYDSVGITAAGITPSNVNADLNRGPYNFGDPADPNVNENPSGENPIENDRNHIYTTGPGETNLDQGGIRLDMTDSLQNTGNPLNNSVNETPAGHPPGTGEAENNTD